MTLIEPDLELVVPPTHGRSREADGDKYVDSAILSRVLQVIVVGSTGTYIICARLDAEELARCIIYYPMGLLIRLCESL